MNCRERFLGACFGKPVDRPPVWLMRQAGRYLPEYRELRARHDFLTLCQGPGLITQASLQPWQRFGLDAVIVFSDILIAAQGMGMELEFVEGEGPKFPRPLRSKEQVQKLGVPDPKEAFGFLNVALAELKGKLKGETALIGFCGGPWTVACYMVQGNHEEGFPELKRLSKQEPGLLKTLLEKVTACLESCLLMQIAAGADSIQIFDTWACLLDRESYKKFALPYASRLVKAIQSKGVPAILFCKDSGPLLLEMAGTNSQVISIGKDISLRQARKKLGGATSLQGNLDPQILLEGPEATSLKTRQMLEEFGHEPGFIANLAHGVLPETPVESVEAFVEGVK